MATKINTADVKEVFCATLAQEDDCGKYVEQCAKQVPDNPEELSEYALVDMDGRKNNFRGDFNECCRVGMYMAMNGIHPAMADAALRNKASDKTTAIEMRTASPLKPPAKGDIIIVGDPKDARLVDAYGAFMAKARKHAVIVADTTSPEGRIYLTRTLGMTPEMLLCVMNSNRPRAYVWDYNKADVAINILAFAAVIGESASPRHVHVDPDLNLPSPFIKLVEIDMPTKK